MQARAVEIDLPCLGVGHRSLLGFRDRVLSAVARGFVESVGRPRIEEIVFTASVRAKAGDEICDALCRQAVEVQIYAELGQLAPDPLVFVEESLRLVRLLLGESRKDW